MFADALILAAAFEILPFYQQKPDYTALRPLWSSEAETTDVIWPVFTSHRDWWRFCWFVHEQDFPEGGYQFDVLPLWWNGREGRRKREEGRRSRGGGRSLHRAEQFARSVDLSESVKVVHAVYEIHVLRDSEALRDLGKPALLQRRYDRLPRARGPGQLQRGHGVRIQALRLRGVRIVVLLRKRVPVLAFEAHAYRPVERLDGKCEVVAVEPHLHGFLTAPLQHDVESVERRPRVVEQRPVPVPEYVLHFSFNAFLTAFPNAFDIDCIPRSFG